MDPTLRELSRSSALIFVGARKLTAPGGISTGGEAEKNASGNRSAAASDVSVSCAASLRWCSYAAVLCADIHDCRAAAARVMRRRFRARSSRSGVNPFLYSFRFVLAALSSLEF